MTNILRSIVYVGFALGVASCQQNHCDPNPDRGSTISHFGAAIGMNSCYDDHLNNMRQQLETLQQDALSERQQLNESEHTLEQLIRELANVKADNADQFKQAAALREELQDKQAVLQRLKKQLRALEKRINTLKSNPQNDYDTKTRHAEALVELRRLKEEIDLLQKNIDNDLRIKAKHVLKHK